VKRRKLGPSPSTGGSNTRLAYSTGGETPVPERTPAADAGRSPGIRLRLERRASGRVVTVVTGLPGTPAEVEALAKTLKSACGAGGTVKDGQLELQGDHRDRIETALVARGLKSKRSGG
jgi:translation initiation factor 1